ncbi:hypothetical protein ACEN9H_29570 [Massilia cellulosiltytica]|jgi:hypothetical protein
MNFLTVEKRLLRSGEVFCAWLVPGIRSLCLHGLTGLIDVP